MPTASWIWRIALSAYLAGSFGGAALSADLLVAMPNWPSGQAGANILKLAIGEKFGLDAEVKELGTMLAFAGLDSGEVDIVPEVWRPNFDDLVKRYGADGSKSVVLGHLAVPAWQGLCATQDAANAGIKDVADLGDPAWASKFHVWAMVWDDRKIDLFLDDVLMNTSNLADMLNPDGQSPFRQQHYLLVNLAIGGMNGGNPANTQFPQRYEVDYVRVFQAE